MLRIFISLLLPLFLFALPLEVLINNAISTHDLLKAKEKKMSMFDESYALNQNFKDPTLSLNINDIQLQDIMNRSQERMQSQSISISQKIPYFGKRDANAKKIDAQKHTAFLEIQKNKIRLVKEIKITAYAIWKKEETLKITDDYINLTQQNIKLYSAFSTSDSKSHMSIMSAEMTLSQLRIKHSSLQSSLIGLYKRISYLSNMEVSHLEQDMKIYKPFSLKHYLSMQDENIVYKMKESTLNEANKNIKIQELKKYSDPKIKIGYFNRSSFEDYISLGLSFALPIYGSQNIQVQKAQKYVLSLEKEKTDIQKRILSEIEFEHTKLLDSYRVHKILKHESMPQIEHMFALSSSSIKSGDELFLYIELLAKKLSLDEQNIAVIARYHTNLALLNSLIGAKK